MKKKWLKWASRNKNSADKAEMLFCVLALFLLCLFRPGEILAQNARTITVNKQNVPFEEIVRQIESQTDYTFMYSTDAARSVGRVSVNVTNGEVKRVLDAALAGKPFSYRIDGKVIILSVRSQAPSTASQRAPKIGGVVLDGSGKPLPGAVVQVKGSKNATSADAQGRFEIEMPAGAGALVVSYIGKETREVFPGGAANLNITLEESTQAVSDVVVTGIFDKPRESNTGSTTTMTNKELKAAGNRNILASIQTIDPSFNISESMEFGSDPNRLPDITMRGRTSMDVNVRDLQEQSKNQSNANMPLFILDGFEVSLQRVMDMDQELVASITLLKDASATALYGSRGANGVVVITSKRPEPGNLRVSYRGTVNFEIPDFTSYNLMNSREKLEYEKAAGLYYTSIDDSFQSLQEVYNQRLIEVERGVDTYWLKYPVRTGVGNRQSLTLDGGADNFMYSAGVSYNNVAGVMKESSRNTFSGNMFFQYEFKNIKFQNDLTLLYNKSYNSPYGSFSDYTSANPIYTPYDDEGRLKKILVSPYSGNTPPQVGNPLFNATLPYRDDGSYTNVKNNFAVEWHINPDLFVRGRLGVTQQESRTDRYLSREHTSFETDAYAGENYKMRGSYNYGTGYLFSWEGDVTMNYSKTLAERHQLYVGLSFGLAEEKNETYAIAAAGFAAINMSNLGMAGSYPAEGKPTSTESHSRRGGPVMNVNYTYDRRYFADFSGKLEGSSKFGANNRIAPFWSAGLGWNLHNESFMRDVRAVNNLRLRVSYGTTGSQNFSAYQALDTYRYYLTEGYEFWNGSYLIALGNPDLTWQKTSQANLGVEAQLFNRRVNVTFDLYDKLTDDLLTDINLPISAGYESYKANVGEVRNRGIELNATVFILQNPRGFTWSVGGNMVCNRNEILKISNALEFLNDELMEASGPNPSFLYKEGESMNTIYAVRSLGIDPATGKEVFLNRYGNRTEIWNAEDKVPCGIDEPRVKGNLRTMVRWRGFSLNASFAFNIGGDIYNSTLVNKVENISTIRTGVQNPWNNLDRRALHDRWQKAGDNAYFKDIADFNATNASSRFVMRENSLRMSSVNLSYEFDREWLRKNLDFVEYINLAFYAEDSFYLSTIKRERGTDYPFARQFSFSLSTRF